MLWKFRAWLPFYKRPNNQQIPTTLNSYLKKWLSYRESKILDRPLQPEEVQHFTDTARRVAAMIQLAQGNY